MFLWPLTIHLLTPPFVLFTQHPSDGRTRTASSSKTTISAYPCQLEIQKLSKNQELPFDLHQPIYIVSFVKITFIYFNLVFYSFTEGDIFKCVHDKTISKREGEIIHELMRSINVLVFFTSCNINLSCFEKEWA